MRNLRQFDYYQGSAAFTVRDMLTWLLDNSNKYTSNTVWLAYCQGLAGGTASSCRDNPLNGNPNIYREVPLGKAMAGIGLTMLGIYGGALCEAMFGDDTGVGTIACGYGMSAAVNTGLTALGGKWDAESVVMDVVSSYLGGTASAVSAVATNSRAIGMTVNMGVGSFNGFMTYAGSTNGNPTLSGSLISMGLGALQSYSAEGWADLFESVAVQVAADGGEIANGSY